MSQSQPQHQIRGMLNLAKKSIPQLHLAQVWLPCNQSSCMELKIFKGGMNEQEDFVDELTSEFVVACGFHNIQNGQGIVGLALSSTNKSYFCKELSEFSITEYPVKHYAQRARLSSCFAICLRNKRNGNDTCVFEFFLQPQSREDVSSQSILHLLLKIMEKELKSFEIATERYLGAEYQPLDEHILAIPMKTSQDTFSVLEFKEFFQKIDLSCSEKRGEKNYGYICWRTKGEELSENRGNDSSMPLFNLGTEGIKLLLSEIISTLTRQVGRRREKNDDFLIQFWAPKLIDNKSVLSTSEQPFALGHLRKGLCWYRKQCVQYLYYIGDGAKEEELGSPGRVFLNGRPESSLDPRLYSRREFPLRDYLVSGGATMYLALPLFGLLDKKRVGVLEFVGFPRRLDQIYEKLEKYNLRSTHLSHPYLKSTHLSHLSSPPIAVGKKQALSEIKEMLTLVLESPQLQTALLWIPCSQCAHNNTEISCMEQRVNRFNYDWRIHKFIDASLFHHTQITNGMIGKVIESESKLYFCEDLCSSSICEQPLAHYVQVARLEICFAICLKSSYTGSSLYVIEFFLSPHSTKYEYSRTLCLLLSMMKQMLKSFKVASGRQLGPELIFEVRELCHEIEHHLSKKVVHFESDGIDDASNIEQERNIVDAINVEDEAQNTPGVNFEEGNERDRSSTSFHVSYEQLKSQFGKSRKDAAKNLGVSISAFTRKCGGYNIHRWPSKKNSINNPSLFQKKVAIKGVDNADCKTSAPSGFILKTSDYPIEPNLSSHSIEKTTELANIFQVPDVVIKAKFKGYFLKFEFCVSRGVEKLMEEVGKRLKLKTGEFRLKYVDDEHDEILLTCDDDLNICVKSMKSLGFENVTFH